MKTLYLHIGMPKTGSTSIQSAMSDAREALDTEGLSYLRFGRNHSGVFRLLVGQTRKADRPPLSRITLRELGLAAGDRVAVLDRVHEIAKASRDMAVVSGEGFFGFTPSEVAVAKAVLAPHFDVIRIVVYLRDPISWASSRAQQAIKTGRSTEAELIEDVDRRGRSALIVPGYHHLRCYIDAFGREAMICRPFDREAFVGGDLIGDFLTTIGRGDLAGKVGSRISNPSLSQEAVQILDAFDARCRHDALEPKVAARVRRRIEGLPGRTYTLPSVVLQKVYDLAREDLDWLDREFGLDLLRGGPRLPETRPAMDRHTADALAELVIELVRKPVVRARPSHAKSSRRRTRMGLLGRLLRKLGLSSKPGAAKPVRHIESAR